MDTVVLTCMDLIPPKQSTTAAFPHHLQLFTTVFLSLTVQNILLQNQKVHSVARDQK